MKKGQTTLFQTWGYHAKHKQTCDDLDDDALGDLFKDEIFIDDNLLGEKSLLETEFNDFVSEETIPGFDTTAGNNYMYPTNYPIREYQYKIIKKALLKNTLVVLPTGLGKTFIAAVVMYNFFRWYPCAKIIFMAPTKPLVAQQVEACHDIMGIPQEETGEMTGAMPPTKRQLLWKNKRVFFLTPQILQNDLERGTCCAKDIVCLVFDEAHKALGNHAYCQVVKNVSSSNAGFRILALSATPGDDMTAVQQVVNNLLISHVEIRSEESNDIKRYVHNRSIEKVVVPMSEELKKIKAVFLELLSSLVKRLCSKKVLWQADPDKVSKYLLIKAREQWRANNVLSDKTKMGIIEGDFALSMSLYHAYEVLQIHGILSFYNFLKGVLSGTKGTSRSKMELSRNNLFMRMMNELHMKLEPEDANQSFNGSLLNVKPLTTKQRLLKSIPKPQDGFYSHPKLEKLEEIVLQHFQKEQCEYGGKNNTRVMIFAQYRDSVQEITALLNKHEPLIRVMSFIGQGNKEGATWKKEGTAVKSKGLSQKEQIEILKKFREGGFNTVVSTSVGEEGLDIGDVDLIICFDVSNSPIRLVQRMGRTGRKRNGRIVILVGEGKEEAIYKRSQSSKKGIHNHLSSAAKTLRLYAESRRLIPKHINPSCVKVCVEVDKYRKNIKENVSMSKSKKVKSSLRINNEYEGTSKAITNTKKTIPNDKSKTFLKEKKNRNVRMKRKDDKPSWKEEYMKSLENGDDSYENPITGIGSIHENEILKNKFSEKSEEFLKPCSLEQMLQNNESSFEKIKKKVRLKKLPKRLSEEAEYITDNQIGFCSQVSMDTLFNRCQKKRKSQTEDVFIKENNFFIDTDSIGEVDQKKFTHTSDEKFENSQGLSHFLPMTSPLQTKTNESTRQICVVSPIVRGSEVPEAPVDVDLSSFIFDDNEIFNNENEIGTTSKQENFTNIVEKKKTLQEEHDLFSNDDDDDFDEFPSSPPVVSQMMQAKHNLSVEHMNNDKISEQQTPSPGSTLENEMSPIKRKRRPKRIIEDDSHDNEDDDADFESSLFRKRKQKSKLKHVFELQATLNTVQKKNHKLDVKKQKLRGGINCTKKRSIHTCVFLDEEAKDDCDESHHENEVTIGGYLLDSFIDDATQITPAPCKKRKTKDEGSPNMHLIYKQSLMSPKYGALNFRTPALKANRNRYKMVEHYSFNSDESSDAEEVNGVLESGFFEDEQIEDKDVVSEEWEKIVGNNKIEKSTLKTFGRVKAFADSDDEDFLSNNNTSHCAMKEESDDARADTIDCRPWCKTFSADEVSNATFSFRIPWKESPVIKIVGGDIVSSDYVTHSHPAVVFMDSRCVANSQVGTFLRTKRNCHVIVQSHLGCDYAVGVRCGVVKRLLSDVSNGSHSVKLKTALTTLRRLYEKPYLIIEKDRVKKGAAHQSKRQLTKYYSSVLAKLSCTNITLLFSANQEESADLISKLVIHESKVGPAVFHTAEPHNDQMIKLLVCIKSVTYPIALEVTKHFKNINQVINSSFEDLKRKLSAIPCKTVSDIFFFFRHKFDGSAYISKNV